MSYALNIFKNSRNTCRLSRTLFFFEQEVNFYYNTGELMAVSLTIGGLNVSYVRRSCMATDTYWGEKIVALEFGGINTQSY